MRISVEKQRAQFQQQYKECVLQLLHAVRDLLLGIPLLLALTLEIFSEKGENREDTNTNETDDSTDDDSTDDDSTKAALASSQEEEFPNQVVETEKTNPAEEEEEDLVPVALPPSSPTAPPCALPPPIEVVLLPDQHHHPLAKKRIPAVGMAKLISSASIALMKGIPPEPISEGMSGTYFLKDSLGNRLGVFKPNEEEAFAPANPKGLKGKVGDAGLKKGIQSGAQAQREVTSYLIDLTSPSVLRTWVPPTALVRVNRGTAHSPSFQEGSFQAFAQSTDTVGDLSPSLFPTASVHAIALLDMRLLNADRHDGNVLVNAARDHQKNTTEFELIPIDHGCCLPSSLAVSDLDWAWLTWPQMRQPLSDEMRGAVLSLDTESSARLCRSMGIPEKSIRNMVLATKFIQECVRVNPSIPLGDVATAMCRFDERSPSLLERIANRCAWRAAATTASGSQQLHGESSTSLAHSSLRDRYERAYDEAFCGEAEQFSLHDDRRVVGGI